MSKIKSYTPQFEDYKNVAVPDLKIDATNPDNLSNKVLSEQESRKRILTHARLNGCEKEILLTFQKYDKLMKNCTNDQERIDMGKLGAIEIYQILGAGGELVVNGQVVCKDK